MHNEDLHNVYSSSNVVRIIKTRRMRWVGHVARLEANCNAYSVMVGKPEGKRAVGRNRRRRENVITMDLRDIRRGATDCIKQAQERD
jgi:hypothetical protein